MFSKFFKKKSVKIKDQTNFKNQLTGFKGPGYTATSLKKGGYPAWAAKAAGYTIAELKEGGYSARALKMAGFPKEEVEKVYES